MFRCYHCQKLLQPERLKLLSGVDMLTPREISNVLTAWYDLFKTNKMTVSQALDSNPFRGVMADFLGLIENEHAQKVECGRILAGISAGGPLGHFTLMVGRRMPKKYWLEIAVTNTSHQPLIESES